ncbi:hypothetical protein GYA49_06430 [Candidatus Beckwithbacteria bacterium]|nr:hypothetical protein [Candidatus Beckwithbacteria bacterium]
MTAPTLEFINHHNESVVKTTTDLDFELRIKTDQADLEYDIWTNWNARKFTSKKLSLNPDGQLELLLPGEKTGKFQIIVRFFDKQKNTWQESDLRLEVHVDPDWVYDAIVYNIFLRTYGAKGSGEPNPGEGGTFEDVITHMDELAKLGITVIYLNPFHLIGDLYRKYNPNNHLPYYLQPGSPYSIKDYKSIDPEVAFPQKGKDMLLTDPKKQFHKLVSAAHKRGMRIFMDLVFNHTSHDFVLQRLYPEWYLYKEEIDSADSPYIWPQELKDGKPWGDPKHTVVPYDYGQFSWTDTAKLNWEYFTPPAPNDPPPNTKKKEMYDYFKSVPQYWVKEFGVDGFRCDIAYQIPPDFWQECIWETRAVAKKFYPKNGAIDGEVIFIAESRQDDLNLLFDVGFSYVYGDYSNKLFNPLQLKGYLDYMYNLEPKTFPEGSKWFIFPECHDFHRTTSKLVPGHVANNDQQHLNETEEAAIRGNASRWILTACLPGMPMVFNGFEKVEWSQVDHVSYSKINWKSSQDILPVIKQMNQLRHNHIALQKGAYQFVPSQKNLDEQSQAFAFYRYFEDEIMLIVVNMDIINKAQATLVLPEIPLFDPDKEYILKDLLSKKIYRRDNRELFIELEPGQCHLFLIEQQWG